MFTATAVTVSIVVIALLFFIARRAVRLFVRLALIGIVILAVLVGVIAFKWYGSSDTLPQNRPAGTRRPASR